MLGSKLHINGATPVGIVFLVLGLSACGQAVTTENPTPSAIGTLIPYRTVTPSPVVASATENILQPTVPDLPKPTPLTYKVVKGDTMLAIALRYGISLEELLAANPKVDPRFLSVDTILIIPKEESASEFPVNPTPLLLMLAPPHCYRVNSENADDGGVWCFVLIENNQTQPVDNISLWVGLYTNQGEVAGGLTTTPLNLLTPGKQMPAMLYFPPPLPQEFSPLAELLTSAPVQINDQRYLLARLEEVDEEIDGNGLQANVRGLISLPENSSPASQVWLVLIAYSSSGEVVGVRKWEANGSVEQPVVLKGGENLSFDVTVFSLGAAIKHLEVLVEARP